MAFKFMQSLEEIWIPDAVTEITFEQFAGCFHVQIHYKGHIYTYADLDAYKIFS